VVSADLDVTCLVNIGRDDGFTASTIVAMLRYGSATIDQSTGDFLGSEVAELSQAKVVMVDAIGMRSTI
jgi:hypothetical protein